MRFTITASNRYAVYCHRWCCNSAQRSFAKLLVLVSKLSFASSNHLPAADVCMLGQTTLVPYNVDEVWCLKFSALFLTRPPCICLFCSGNIILRDIVLSSPQLGGLSCPNSTPTALPGGNYTCQGTYTVTALDLETGLLSFTATGASSSLTAGAQKVAAAQAAILTMQAQPQLDLDILAATCTQTQATGKRRATDITNNLQR